MPPFPRTSESNSDRTCWPVPEGWRDPYADPPDYGEVCDVLLFGGQVCPAVAYLYSAIWYARDGSRLDGPVIGWLEITDRGRAR